MKNAIESPLFAMVDGRFARIDITFSDLGPQDEILRRMSLNIPTNLKNAFVLPGGRLAHVQTKSDLIICWTELASIKVSTVWTISSDGEFVYPVFKAQPTNSPPEHEASRDWEPLISGMRIFFASTFQFEGNNYIWKNSYLVAKAPKRKEIFRPPFPNIFADSRMCMGNDYHPASPCLADAFSHTVNHLMTSKWNHDAMEGLTGDHIRALFSYKDDKQQPPPKEYKWLECPACHTVNNQNYGELPIV